MTPAARVPDLLLEQLALGELSPERAAEIRQRLDAEPDGAARLAAIEQSSQEILEQYPAHQQAPAIEERWERERRTARPVPLFRRPVALAAPLAVAAAALLVAVWALPTEDPYVGFKGDPRLVLHRRDGTAVERLESGATAREGDLIQVGYLPGGAAHGVILSVDGRGAVTLHLPADPGQPTALEGAEGVKGRRGGPSPTAFSFELDDAPAFERFFFVVGPEPIDVAAVLAAARALGPDPRRPLALPAGLRQVEFVLRKPAADTPSPM